MENYKEFSCEDILGDVGNSAQGTVTNRPTLLTSLHKDCRVMSAPPITPINLDLIHYKVNSEWQHDCIPTCIQIST